MRSKIFLAYLIRYVDRGTKPARSSHTAWPEFKKSTKRTVLETDIYNDFQRILTAFFLETRLLAIRYYDGDGDITSYLYLGRVHSVLAS